MNDNYTSQASAITHVPAGQGATVWFDGDVYTVKANKENTNGTLAFLEATIPPGGGPPPHAHTLEDEAFYILSGELEFFGNEQHFTVKAGDFVFVPRGAAHRFNNMTAHAVRMIFLYTPAGFENFFVGAGDPAVPGDPIPVWGPSEFKRATEMAARYGWQKASIVDADS
ncbi:cupin domain-containing protein [Nocardia sp. NPDC051570]|uniref:cupin domain-containing protein n=1 Tax=Nocardia sp. NPDC051570 TaxID=3364324 RepID=UPI0037AA945D